MLQSIIQDETADFDRAEVQGSIDHDYAAQEDNERLKEANKVKEIEK